MATKMLGRCVYGGAVTLGNNVRKKCSQVNASQPGKFHMRYSYSDRIAQVVERDASNIKVVSSILTAVKVFFTFPVETHSLESTFS